MEQEIKVKTALPVYETHENYAGLYTGHSKTENYLEVVTDNYARVRIYVLEDNLLRFRYSTDGLWERDFSYAVDNTYTPSNPDFTVLETDNRIILQTAELDVHIKKEHLFTTVYNKNGEVVNEDEKGFHWEEYEKHGGNIVLMSKKTNQAEAFYGLGDKPVDLNLRGNRFCNWGTDQYGYEKTTDPLYKNINLYYGLHHNRGYAIFQDNTFKTFFDFAAERKNVTSFWSHGGEMNYYFMYGPSLMRTAELYAKLTGRPELPPMWALGYQQCKWSYEPDRQVLEIASKMRELKIPCDAIYLDIDYMDGFRCFTWDDEKFPDPKGMVEHLKNNGFQTMVIIDPGIKIDREYSVFKEGLEKGFFCKRADGPYIKGKVWPGDCYFPDFTNPEAREWWAGLFKELIQDIGIAGVWNDMNEPALFEVDSKTFPHDVRHDYDGDPCSHRKAHNIYGMQMTRATAEGVKRFKNGERTLIITRSGYSGMQRFTSVWTGDNIANWDHLLIAHQQTQRLNVSGISFCGSDIGGFIGQPTGELFARWMQQAVFHPFFRTHSSGDHGDQEPWSFGEEYLDMVRESINMRYRLLPYIYTTFYQNHTNGTPMLRPLVFAFEGDAQNLANKHMECMLGDHMLYCPIVRPGVKGRMVYLPVGKWFNYHDETLIEGGHEQFVETGFDRIPTFVKAGAIIPHFPLMQYVGEKHVDCVELKVYFKEGEESSYLYADNYNNEDYLRGHYSYSRFDLIGGKDYLEIRQSCDSDYKPGHDSFELKLIGMNFSASKAELDGQEVSITNSGTPQASLKVPYNFKLIRIS